MCNVSSSDSSRLLESLLEALGDHHKRCSQCACSLILTLSTRWTEDSWEHSSCQHLQRCCCQLFHLGSLQRTLDTCHSHSWRGCMSEIQICLAALSCWMEHWTSASFLYCSLTIQEEQSQHHKECSQDILRTSLHSQCMEMHHLQRHTHKEDPWSLQFSQLGCVSVHSFVGQWILLLWIQALILELATALHSWRSLRRASTLTSRLRSHMS